MAEFVALDFETADYGADSACAIALVRVRNDTIIKRTYSLIRPPRSYFRFTHIHGLRWSDVADQPTFAELWPSIVDEFADVDFVAAHNASFDKGVLAACCAAAGLVMPDVRFECTVKLAKKTWGLKRANLAAVSEFLNIPLVHHQALSDAEACARIVIAANQAGA
ncbi:MAG TPA: 3'-5' exonuclease [Fluviicoccus sp.]|nr:3'-5' exonuclease [Fluviicoccus sp.]